ncbi:membrane-spanning 4-domains subfamily A member 4A-like isoform X2 [Trichosurus vulpecula]|uniref:membrane-spanning 4-domains subfamily A member 4A-like isoform X2 n=1 Tax=Trichosurus vulpecula TaxID=9337 RepID=UPI00186B49D5|nr:membrane-spanning 4-domains subfamily A member 4A-like isoform X2 [Trichosurus vulpecula]
MDSQETPKGMVSSYPQSGFISFSQGAMQAPMRLYKSKAALQKFLKGEPKALGFIISGSLTIAAENRATNTLIQSSLAMNIVSSVVAGLGIIFFAVNLVMSDHAYYYYCHQEGYYDVCAFGHSILLGINFILLILTILEFILSLTTSGFGCKASCCDQSGVTVFMPSPPYVPENPAAEACKGGTTFLSPAADTSAFPGSHPDSFV